MGLTANSTGSNAIDHGLCIEKHSPEERVIALAGNPNVGKSTVFNELTGLNQHTGNWPGKTVTNAQGRCSHNGIPYILVDIPEPTPDGPLRRGGSGPGFHLFWRTGRRRGGLRRHLFGAEYESGAPDDGDHTPGSGLCQPDGRSQTKRNSGGFKAVVGKLGRAGSWSQCPQRKRTGRADGSGRSGDGEDKAGRFRSRATGSAAGHSARLTRIRYLPAVEDAIHQLEPEVSRRLDGRLNSRWISLQLLDCDDTLKRTITGYLGFSLWEDAAISQKICEAKAALTDHNITEDRLKDILVSCVILRAEEVCMDAVACGQCGYGRQDRKIDRVLTNKWTGIPLMLLMLVVVFWITITGANYPSNGCPAACSGWAIVWPA